MPREKKTIMALHWHEDDRGGINLEFISKDVRFGICFEGDLSESSWYCVTKADDMVACVLPEDLLSALASHLTA